MSHGFGETRAHSCLIVCLSADPGRDSMARRFCDSCRRVAGSTTAVASLSTSMTGLHFYTYLEIDCHRIYAPLNPAPVRRFNSFCVLFSRFLKGHHFQHLLGTFSVRFWKLVQMSFSNSISWVKITTISGPEISNLTSQYKALLPLPQPQRCGG